MTELVTRFSRAKCPSHEPDKIKSLLNTSTGCKETTNEGQKVNNRESATPKARKRIREPMGNRRVNNKESPEKP